MARRPPRAPARGGPAPGQVRAGAVAVAAACLALVAAVALLYQPVRHHRFVSFDDPVYVTENPVVRGGWSADGIRYALGGSHGGNWHPVTTVSHLLDVEWLGAEPEDAGGHLGVSAALHALNAVLLLLLRALTGSFWASLGVAAFFALHPLRVESVAWVSSRKDVLSGLFFLLTLLAWASYVRAPPGKGRARYLAVLGCYALGLMAKPMLVTLPLLLLLLDRWPLGRWGGRLGPPWGLWLEKAPLLGLAAISSAVTVVVQQGAGAVGSLDVLPLDWRLVNAPIAYALYLWKTVWPVRLASFYPHPGLLPSQDLASVLPASLAALLLLVAISVLALRLVGSRPYLLVGWLWFLGMLVPVLGLVQVGSQSMADRYSYLPHVGLGIAGAWALRDLARRRPRTRPALAAGAVLGAAALAVLTGRQIPHWRDSESLYLHAIAATRDNYLAHQNLGNVYLREERLDDALAQYRLSLGIRPDDARLHSNLGALYTRRGDERRARQHLRRALQLDPGFADARANLARLLLEQSDGAAAEAELRRALERQPDAVELRRGLATLLFNRGDPAGAAAELEAAVRASPGDAELLNHLGLAWLAAGEGAGAARAFRRAIAAVPTDAHAHNGLAWVLATSRDDSLRDAPEALRLARRAAGLSGHADVDVLDTLAAAHAASGDFAEALRWQQRAIELAPADRRPPLEERLVLYRSGRPFRESE